MVGWLEGPSNLIELIEFNARLEKTLEKFEDTFKQDELKEA
jgi:hypothetical protein